MPADGGNIAVFGGKDQVILGRDLGALGAWAYRFFPGIVSRVMRRANVT